MENGKWKKQWPDYAAKPQEPLHPCTGTTSTGNFAGRTQILLKIQHRRSQHELDDDDQRDSRPIGAPDYVAEGLEPVGGHALAPNEKMASKINPWRSLRSLTIRTRPSGLNHHVPAATTRAAVPLGRRGLAGDTSMRPPPDDGDFPPPYSSETTPQPYQPRPIEPFADNFMNEEAIAALEQAAAGQDALNLIAEGLKFGMPTPPSKHDQLQDRHHPVVHQVTRMLMRDGKLSKAQKVRIHSLP
ncbi:hypothetical protein CHU98_g10760 [Xylaria longipes]|nr:hypothetical protein CHU98_g10760 [Xylaria longipes]